MDEQGRKTLRDYILQGGIAGKWFENRVYDPNNPFYRVDDTKIIQGNPDMAVLDQTLFPKERLHRHAIIHHYDDLEALPADIARFQQTATEKEHVKVLPKKATKRSNVER